MIATLFYNPMPLPTSSLLWLLAPLCAAVAIVYKTLRAKTLPRLPLEIGVLVFYMVAGLGALGACLWLVQEYWQ